MRRLWTLALLAAALPLAAEPAAVLVKVGVKDEQPTEWQGTVAVSAGRLLGLEGWLFTKEDGLDGDAGWHLTTNEQPAQRNQPRTLANGLVVRLDAPADATLTIRANDRDAAVKLADLAWAKPVAALDGALELERVPVVTTLQDLADREDDCPAACALPNGDLVAAWQSWNEGAMADRLYFSRLSGGNWSAAEQIPGVEGDLYRPAVSGDGTGGLWLVWTQMVGDDYELLASRLADGTWSKPQNLTNTPGHDTDVALTTTSDGTVYAVWRAYRGGSADILMAVCRGGTWSEPTPVDASPANEWAPDVASGPGGVWAVWDSYRSGSYDVFATQLSPDGPGELVALAATPRFEAKASVACAANGEVWVAWQDAGEQWGKDTGQTVPKERTGQRIHQERNIQVACLRNGQWFDAPDPAASVAEGARRNLELPRLGVDPDGRVWLTYRLAVNVVRQAGRRNFGEKAWENYATWLAGDAWVPARRIANRMGRQDAFVSILPARGGIELVFHTDGRELTDLRRMTHHRIFAASVPADAAPQAPTLTPRTLAAPVPVNEQEAAQLARCRAYQVTVDGKPNSIVRGDLHRHTEVSWDGTGDGSLYDSYRYTMDAAALDFYLCADHNQRTGVDLPYINWWCYKLADVMHNPGVFTTLFGYERSLGFPNGHRNILQAKRGYPSCKMIGDLTDLPKLYQYAHETNAIVVPHTTGTNHGTNWYAYDRSVEPVVEIFQGCRLSYEYEGCPKGGSPGDAQATNTGYQPQGFVWRAWQRDIRIGIISSSDHGSTHYSYACVYTPEKTRQGVIDALRTRHTYGANDNLIVDLRCGNRFMGDEWQQNDPPTFDIRIQGTGELKQVDIIRDYQFVYTVDPEGDHYETQWQDNQFTPGTHLYYLRVQQDDTTLAWGSPVWIERG